MGLTVVNYGQNETKATSFVRTRTKKEQVPQRGFKEAHVLAVVNKGRNTRKKNILPQNKSKPRRKCRSVVSRMQGGIRFVQWRIRRRRIVRTRFWKSLSRNIAFFCFPLFFLTDCWYIPRWSTSFFVFWGLIEPRALVTFGEILPSITMKFIDFLHVLSWLCFAFYPISVPERFMATTRRRKIQPKWHSQKAWITIRQPFQVGILFTS